MGLKVPHRYRVRTGRLGTTDAIGNNGLFRVPTFDNTVLLFVIVSNTDGWEHVSVSCENRCPTWDEMEYIKRMFWDSEDTVIHYHPPRSKYVNCCEHCLHMWRKIGAECELPPSWMIA